MAKEDEVWTQLATRIPKGLHRMVRLHCIEAETSIMTFVVEAIEERLEREGRRRSRRARE